MRILWITNQATPQLAEAMNIKTGFGGGWMADLSVQLASLKDIKLEIAFPVSENYTAQNEKIIGQVIGVCVPLNKFVTVPQKQTIDQYIKIISDFNPDIIHIWGTEYIHSYCAIKACDQLKRLDSAVISIQGLVSIYAKHFWGYIDEKRECPFSLKDFIKHDSLGIQQKSFENRGKYEEEAIKLARHVIGRTDWDKACVEQINSNAEYHFCNETLRKNFYHASWSLESCEKHSIFLSQCQYPIKGLHLLLQAMPKILERYPDAHIYTTGKNRMISSFKGRLKLSSYDIYIRKKIIQYHLGNNITFVGALNEQDMCKRFLKSHVFVSASSIENSPNSVGEAMLIGVPTVSSDVGGVKNMLEHGKDGFIYPADEPYMIAYYVNKIFDNDELATQLSINSQYRARETHNAEKNLSQLICIYNKMVSS